MKNSPIYWRFDSAESKMLESVHNSTEQSIEIWDSRISSKYLHLMQLPRNWDEGWKEVRKFNADIEQSNIGHELLLSIEPNSNPTIIFFWSRRYSVTVDWRFFLTHWTNFCYPDDDTIAIVFDDHRLLTFCEERFTLFTRKSN